MKKIFYIPGLISAVCVPLLFWYYGNRKLQEPIPNVMDLGLPAKIDSTNEWAYQYSFEPYRDWDYKKIVVEPNTARKKSKFYVSEIENLQKRNQKNTGIEFVINDQNSYDDFVSLLNDCHITKQEMYGVDDKTGHFFVLVNYQDPNAEECGLCNDTVVIYEEYKSSFFEKFEAQLSQLPKQGYYLIFGFLILSSVSIISIKKSFQNP